MANASNTLFGLHPLLSFHSLCHCLKHAQSSRLHLVDAELDRYKGREKQLLRKYEQEQRESEYREHERRRSSEHAPFDTATSTAVGAKSATVQSRRGYAQGTASRMSAVQQAHEEETRRVQEAIRQRVESLSARAASRR